MGRDRIAGTGGFRRGAARRVAGAVASVALALIAAGPAGARRAVPAASAGRGSVSVLFAGSLVNYFEDHLGPAFQRSTGYGFLGFGGGSSELASELRGGVRRGDVFISASAAADRSLEGAANGGWVSWYSTFAASPLLLAYNPQSPFAAQLRRGMPWYRVLAEPGIRVGETDPALDPKGVLSVEAVRVAVRKLHDPELARAERSFQVFPETSLIGRLQAGQLDAGFFYAVEARTAKLATVSLSPVYKYAAYTLSILNRAPDPAGAAAFVRYLLSSERGNSLQANGLNPLRPQFYGTPAAAPAQLRRLLGAR